MSNDSQKPDSTWRNKLVTQAADSTAPKQVTTATITAETEVTDRQEKIAGFDQASLADAHVLLVGAGGIGGEIATGLVRKGVGHLTVCDEDIVDATNLNRQQFHESDIGENKAYALAENLVPEGTTGTEIVAHPHHFQDVVALGVELTPDLVICAPDNETARLDVCDHYHGDVPVVFTGLDAEAQGGYVFVQDTATAAPCFRCYRPPAEADAGAGGTCPGAPATIDPTKLVGGVALYAVDTVLMDRPREWETFEFHLSGILPTQGRTVTQQEECLHNDC